MDKIPAYSAESWGQVLPDLFVVSWLGMTPEQVDCHVFALRGEAGILLVDCGTPWGHKRLGENLQRCGLDVADVRTILLTHGHLDHARGGRVFKGLGVEILGHRDIFALVECEWAAQEPVAGAQGACPCRMDGSLADGDEINRCGFAIRVIHTPGHTGGCLSYLIEVNGQPCLFSGDLVMGNGLPGWRGDPGYSPANIVASLRKLLLEDFQHLCYGHGLILNDRGQLFRSALAKQENGAWGEPEAQI